MKIKAFALSFIVLFTSLSFAQPTPRPTPVEIKIEATTFDPYVGQYEDAANIPGLVISFFREGEKFYLQGTNQDKAEMFAFAQNQFFAKPFPASAEFVSENGRVTAMIWRQNGAEFRMKRIADVPAKDTRVPFKRTEAMIPMRDGVKLFTVIFTPENQTAPLPIMLNRTPYGVKGQSSGGINGGRADLVKDGYVFVYQDIRGREDSEGVFEMLRPPRDKRDPKSIDESTDTYDTIEYLIKNIPNNNGRVGIAGVSYDGWLAAVALLDPHPALKASSPQAPVTDLWMGDDFAHNGAFRQTYAHHWAVPLESAKKGGDIKFDNPDLYNWYLTDTKLPDLAKDLATKSHSWKAFIDHPTWDSYWQARAANLYLKDTSVPTMIVGGWWDQEDLYGPLALYRALNKTDGDNQVSLVMGPWNHGGWGGRGRRLGMIDFGTETGNYFKSQIQRPFFARHLHGKAVALFHETMIFRSGSNEWKNYNSWPPPLARMKSDAPGHDGSQVALEHKPLYLHAGGKLSFEKPTDKGNSAFDSYVSDPANPVPYRKRPILPTYGQGSTWFTWLVDDQRFLADRKDVLSWRTDVLTEDFTITGDIIAKLFASTSGSDSDWVVKLIDVYPADYPADEKMENFELMVASEIFRGRFHKGYEKATPIKPNVVTPYAIDMRGNDYTFKKGHRMMVQIQSTWFPLYNRNPQKFVPNIVLATDADYQMATQKIFRSAKHPSHVSVSVVK